MSIDLYRTRILGTLGDPTKARYKDAVLDEALRLALEEYSRAVPQTKETTITMLNSQRDQPLTGAVDLLYLLAVFFPVSADSAPELEAYYSFIRDDTHWVTIQGGAVPQVGDDVRVIYGAAHTVDGLDGATVTTPAGADIGLIVQGAAGHALNIYGDSIVQSYGKRTPQDDVYAAAVRRLRDFRARLKGRRGSGPVPPWAQRWKLDIWDKNS